MKKIKWGILSTAKIGVEKVIPAMQAGQYCEVTAIASRDLKTAQSTAKQLGIAKNYGSYEELLKDSDIDAVYIPLPNHLHVSWSMKALEAGKHVLCEKPIGLNSAEAQKLVEAAERYPKLKIMEAFMYRFHPQWQKAKELVTHAEIGPLRTIQSFFSYYNVDADNIRNKADIGGGGLMDIGCYCISLARFIFDREPLRVSGIIDYDPQLTIDRLSSGMLDFGEGTATFTCSTQLTPYQRVSIYGTDGCVEIEIPFNAPPDKPCKMWLQKGSHIEDIILEICDQYTLQADSFSQAILNDTKVPTILKDSVANMKVIEALFSSSKRGTWEPINP